MSFYCALILYIQGNKRGFIISIGVLPTTEIIEPRFILFNSVDIASIMPVFVFLVVVQVYYYYF